MTHNRRGRWLTFLLNDRPIPYIRRFMVSRMSYEIIFRDLVVNKNVVNKYRGKKLNEVRTRRNQEKFLYIYTNKAFL